MATFSFEEVLVWGSNPAGVVRLLRNASVTVSDAVTGDLLLTLTSSADGEVSFETTDVPIVVITSPGGFTKRVISQDALEAAAGFTVSEDAAVAALLADPGSDTRVEGDGLYAAALVGGKGPVRRDEQRVSVKDYGAAGDGIADDTAEVTAAAAAAIAAKVPLVFPPGTYVVEAPILISGATDFQVEMQGRLKRKNASVRNSLLYFLNCTGVRAKVIRTDGNVLNNTFVQSDAVAYPVDEAKHDVRIEGCTDVEIGLIDSKNPAGDTLYVTGSSTRVDIGTLKSVSSQSSGRNAISLVSCSKVTIDTVESVGTGCTTGVIAMPGGFDIEPNSGQAVTDVQVGKILVETNGTSGCAVFGAYTGSGSLGAGVRQIKRVKLGQVTLVKTSGVRTASCDIPIRGVDDLTIGRLTHTTDAANANQAFAIDDATLLDLNLDITRSGGTVPPNIGVTAAVDNLLLRGRIGASGGHCIQVYALTNAVIDMTLKNPTNGSMLISKNATGASSNVRFRGDWRKDSTGSWAMNIAGTVTGWELEPGLDMTGWVADARVKGAGTPGAVGRRQVRGLTYGTAAPAFDVWAVGHYVENTAPAELGTAGSKYVVLGWVCTVAGTPGTWLPVRALTGN